MIRSSHQAVPLHVEPPGVRRVPVVTDVVVVEDHRARQGRQDPADLGLPPRLEVERGVLLEVGDLVVRRPAGAAALADELAHAFRGVVGVDLVAEHHDQVRPLLVGLAGHPPGIRAEHVRVDRCVATLLARFPARAEQEPHGRPRLSGADPARGIRRIRQRPGQRPIQADLVGHGRARLQAVDDHDRVVVTGNPERAVLRDLRAGPNLDDARSVGLQPDRGFVFVDVPQERTEQEGRHGEAVRTRGLVTRQPGRRARPRALARSSCRSWRSSCSSGRGCFGLPWQPS